MGKKFLIGQLVCFGDCLYATTIARQIKNDYPDSHITWAIATKYKSVLDNNPDVDEVWTIDGQDNVFFHNEGWKKFKHEAQKRKEQGIYDELILSQVPNGNWQNCDGTIRASILRGYPAKITVPVSPVIRLTEQEVDNVRLFAEKHKLHLYKEVILFECAPGSQQSAVNVDFAIEVAQQICGEHPNVCFILSTSSYLDTPYPQIIDASSLTFRENAELAKYCTLLIGCSSGITWLCSSEWAKKLNTVQIIKQNFFPFQGVAYDLNRWGLDSSHVIEFYDSNMNNLLLLLNKYFDNGFTSVREEYHRYLKPEADIAKLLIPTILNNCRNPFILIKIFINILHSHKHIRTGKFAFISINTFYSILYKKLYKIILPVNSKRYTFIKWIYRSFKKMIYL